MKPLTKKVLLASILSCLGISASMAASATANFQVTANVSSTCSVSATNVSFATISPSPSGNAVATGSITSTCTKSTPYTLNINSGGGTFAQRQMSGTSTNTDKLNYNLYTESAYTNIFGDNTGITKNIELTGTGNLQTTTVYSRLPLNQYVTPDTYTDSLVVTLAY